MKRRDAIRSILVFAGGVILVPACSPEPGKASIPLKHMAVSEEDEAFLAALGDTIIPPTNTKGAAELGCHLFVLKMVDDCSEQDAQQHFVSGLKTLQIDIRKRFGHPFVDCSLQERQQVVASLEAKKSPEVNAFYELMKGRLVEGYMTSKYVLIDIKNYQLIPSVKYNGYAPVINA